jgi:hypothetical protein
VFYRLNALIDRASDQGVLAHLVTIAALNRLAQDCYILPGVDLSFPDGTGGEVDLLGLFKGRVIAGEVKTDGASFGRVQLDKDFALTKRIGADIHVMAWMGKLSEQAKDIAKTLAKRNRVDLQSLALDDLRL